MVARRPAADAGGQRRAHDGRVRRQVGRAEQPTAVPARPRRRARRGRPRAARAGPAAAIVLERGGEVGDHDPVLVVTRPSASCSACVARGVPAEDGLVDVVEVVARGRAEPEAAAGHVDRRGDELAPRQPAVARVGLAEGGEGAVRRDRARSDRDRRRRRRRRSTRPRCAPARASGAAPDAGPVDPPVDGVRRPCRRLHGDEAAGAERDEADLVDHRDQCGGDGGVDGGAAGARDLLGGVGSGGVGGGDGQRGHGGPVTAVVSDGSRSRPTRRPRPSPRRR